MTGVTGWEKVLVRGHDLLLWSLHDTKLGGRHLFRNKKPLKGRSISVAERMEHLNKARGQHGFENVWTLDGKIMFNGNDNNPKVYYFYMVFA